jgi:predicted Ser/Thr protein kinase
MPEIGQTVSKYKILKKLGTGGMGEVFLAEDASLGRKVALKFPSREMQHDAVANKRFLREARSAATLNHPNICAIYEIAESDGQDFIVMEYVEGQTLKDRMNRGRLRIKEVLQIAVPVAEALQEAHEKDIVHRDLKPANIMLTPKGQVKLMDFGLAKQLIVTARSSALEDTLTAPTKESTTFGTLAYMSPEQLRSQPVDTRSDIFSFGVVLYEMIAGVHPFKKDTGIETASAILKDVPGPVESFRSSIPASLPDIVMRLLEKDVSLRYQHIEEVRNELAELSNESWDSWAVIKEPEAMAFPRRDPAGDRIMTILQAAQMYYKRWRWPLLVLAGIVILTAATVSIRLYRKNQQLKAQTRLAEAVFYQMRSVEAQLVRQRNSMSSDDFRNLRDRRMKLEQDYDRYLQSLGLYTGRSPIEQATMQLARRLGETDLEVPPDFQKAVMDYVERWRRTPRLRAALDRARQRMLPRRIRLALDQYGLPREFMFLALQESDFDTTKVGPPTPFGIAKGMWQFIPKTGAEYGLTPGPLKDVGQYDPSDQRQDENRATQAAAQYLAFLYSTKAAASGLLVIASYNYGQTRMIERLDQLPDDPRQRNFWNFYRNGWIPRETRDYVMNIFSAALICEHPDLFNMSIAPIDTLW